MRYIFLMALCFLSVSAMAYKVETHQELSRIAIRESVLNPDNLPSGEKPILESLGLQPLDSAQFPPIPGSPLPTTTVQQIVQYGALFEDSGARSLNHFFDPVAANGMGRPLHLSGSLNVIDLGYPSPDWALEDNFEIQDVPPALKDFLSSLFDPATVNSIINTFFEKEQKYSYRDLQAHIYLGLTGQNSVVRLGEWTKVFQALGQVIHHIQDMAQPEHVRNDGHLTIEKDTLKKLGLSESVKKELSDILTDQIGDPSWYEEFTNKQIRKNINTNMVGTMLAASNYGNIRVDMQNPRDSWTTGDDRGIADFTNFNFVSKDTNFIVKDGVIAVGGYSNPAVTAAIRTESLNNLSVFGEAAGAGAALCNALKQSSPEDLPPDYDCPIEFMETHVYDHYTGNMSETNPRASSLSAFDQFLKVFAVNPVIVQDNNGTPESVQVDSLFTLNRYNYDSFQRFLLPRAVKFSAGLIDQIFKKRLKLRKNPSGVGWIVENISNQDLDGEFKLLADGAVLQRHVLNSQNLGLPAGASFIIPATLQDQTTTQMIAVFKGTMEGVQAGFDSVTGVVAPGPDGQRGFVVHTGEVDCNSNPLPTYAALSFVFNSALPQGSFEPSIITDTGLVIDFDAVNIKSASPAVCNPVGYARRVNRIGDYEYVYRVSLTNPGDESYSLNVYNHVNHPELSLGIQFEKIYVTNK
jgi:hypothetical protein